jgi:hypothetical protein
MPDAIHIGVNPYLVDLSSYSETLEGVNTFELNFVVYSDNFSAIRSAYILEVGQALKNTGFYRKPKEGS